MSNKDVTSQIKEAYEEIAAEYVQDNSDPSVVKDILDYFIANIPGKKVLDVGFGSGRDSKYLSQHNLNVTGIDLASNFVKIASQTIPSVIFLQRDMRHLNFQPETFDGLWVCASFIHIPKDEAKDTLNGFYKILTPGGLVLLAVKGTNGRLNIGKKEYCHNPEFFSFYAQEEIIDLVESCNFKIKKIDVSQKKETWIRLFITK